MKSNKILLAAALLVALAQVAFAQSSALAVTDNKPTVDGVVAAGEYSYSQDLGRIQLSLNRTADTLSIGVVGTGTGWVAVGVGSAVMNKATIFIGYVESETSSPFKIQAGSGHSHQDTNARNVTESVVSHALKEAGGKTTLELALKVDTWINRTQGELQLILATGARDSFTAMHSFRTGAKVKLSQ